MGKAIVISGADFSAAGIGQVTPTEYRELLSITLEEGETVGNNVTIDVTYNPHNATYKELIWSIESGSEYATISNGVLSVLKGADNDPVTVKAVSAYDNSIYDTITVYVTRDTANDYDAEVEYLETDGTAYIDTGVNTSSATKFEIEMFLPDNVEGIIPFGARKSLAFNANDSTLELMVFSDSNKWTYRFGNKSVDLNNTLSSIYGNYEINNLESTNKLSFVFGGNTKTITCNANNFDTTFNFFLFCLNNAGSPRTTVSGIRFSSCKLYNNGTLVRDFISVRKNGVGLLFDKVSGTLFGNAASSGAFTYGNDVNT